MSFIKFVLVIALLVVTVPQASSHNWMTQPPPYNRVFKTRNCKGRQCTDACPSKQSSGIANSQERPAATWRRGQRVMVKWAKNNHHGGMIRIALVPVDKMWDRVWHKKMTLLHACWETGEFNCSHNEDCGTDKSGEAFSKQVVIPDVFPDGDYVLGYVWYGGLYYKRDRGHFPDYYSCSHIRIRGGARLSASYQPFFDAGDNRRIVNGKCQTSADEIGLCEHNGCPNTRSFYAIPKVFQNGHRPHAITLAIAASGFGNSRDLQNTSDTSGNSSPAIGGRPDEPDGRPPRDERPTTEPMLEEPAPMLVEDEGKKEQKPRKPRGQNSDPGICSLLRIILWSVRRQWMPTPARWWPQLLHGPHHGKREVVQSGWSTVHPRLGRVRDCE